MFYNEIILIINITESRNNSTQFDMKYGLVLGFYFIVQFFVNTQSLISPLMAFISILFIISLPIFVFFMAKRFKDSLEELPLSFSMGWMFIFLTFFYASLPEALFSYVYLQYINPGFIFEQVETASKIFSEMPSLEGNGFVEKLMENMEAAPSPTPIQYSLQLIFNNMFYGSILAIIIAAILRVKKPY